MTFVVEKISELDFKNSGLSKFSGRYSEWKQGREWIIDRERNIFVIAEGYVCDEPWKSTYVYFYDGLFLNIRLTRDSSGDWNESQVITFSFDSIVSNPPNEFLAKLPSEHRAIWAPLKEAVKVLTEEVHAKFGCTVNFTF